MKRRALLAAIPAVAVLPAVAVVAAVAEAETPIMQLFREWSIINDGLPDPIWDDLGDEAFSTECTRAHDIIRKMMDLPCQSASDFAAKVAAYTFFGEFSLDDVDDKAAFWAEARALIGGAA